MDVRANSPKRTAAAVLAGVLAAVLVVVVLLQSSAAAQPSDFSLAIVVEEVDGATVTASIRADPGSTELGALEGSLVFDPDIVEPNDCDFADELGACNPIGDRLKFSALFVEGLDTPRTFLLVSFTALEAEVPSTLALRDIEAFDTTSAELVGIWNTADFTTDSRSTNPLLIALPVIAVMSAAALLAMRSRNRRT